MIGHWPAGYNAGQAGGCEWGEAEIWSGSHDLIPIAVVSWIGQIFDAVFVLTLTGMDIRLSPGSENLSGSAPTLSEPPWATFFCCSYHFRSICLTYHLVRYLAIYLD